MKNMTEEERLLKIEGDLRVLKDIVNSILEKQNIKEFSLLEVS